MPILSGDVKLLKSAVMADVPEGGGAPTGIEIPDGVSNAIFPDVSELDRAGGRVNLRKVFAGVHTDDTDTYFGANIIVAEPPKDPRVSVALFTNGVTFDPRAEASTRIEAYLNKGPEWGGYLFENHIRGQRVVQLFQRPGSELPVVGQTLVLVDYEGKANEVLQYVRATAVSVTERRFTAIESNSYSDYPAWVVSIDLSDALRYDFRGSPASRTFSRTVNGVPNSKESTTVRDTVVADAGTYVGVVPLVQAADVGDFTVRGSSIFTQLVPNAQTETPIAFAQPYSASGTPVPGVADVEYVDTQAWTPSTNLQLPGGCLPGSLRISTDGVSIFDDAGVLKTASSEIGTIDYANGVLALTAGSFSNSKTVTYRPAARVLRAPQSTELEVTPESRSLSYTGVIVPTAQPGTLTFSYMAQGRWYVLSEQGNGVIKGSDPAFGVGTYNKDTGSFVVTLGALPDVGSSIVVSWGAPTQETIHLVRVIHSVCKVKIDAPPGETVQPGSLTASWLFNGTKTATVATDGTLSGDALGELSAASGELEFSPKVLPEVGAIVTLEYVTGPKQEETFAHPSRDAQGKVPVTAALGSIVPGSLEVEWNTLTDTAVLGVYTLEQIQAMGLGLVASVDPTQYARDDGQGNVLRNGQVVGSVNYATGEVRIQPDATIKIPKPRYSAQSLGFTSQARDGKQMFRLNYGGIEYVDVPSLYPNDETGYVKLRYNSAGATNLHTQEFEFKPTFRLVPEVRAQIVPGSAVLITWDGSFGRVWGDNGQGTLREYTSAGWVPRGTIDYMTGEVTLTSWRAGSLREFVRQACTTTVGEPISSEYVFRTAAAPLRSGSLSITFASAGGGTVTLNSDANGVISGSGVQGLVDYEYGLVRLRFGKFVAAAGNENEPWYDVSKVGTDGTIFKPAPIAMASLRYNAVSYSYLPLDADLLGIDPVRLPTDGRVPIFRPGGFAVVGHTASVTATVSNGVTVNCARVRLSRVRVVGADGKVINTGYTADLEAGTVTFNDVTGYVQPVKIEHRVEDMSVVRGVNINGEITFTRPLTHSYPPGSYISSALVAGDVFARTSTVFDQQSWDGTFKDALVGNAATGTYNVVQYPIDVTNRGALTERWVVRFTNSTSFEVIGENVGLIATGNTSADCTPINPATNAPYFTLKAAGWGGGWATGNVLRINTIGAMFPVWVVRTVQQGPETVTDDSFTLLVRGDVNTD